LFWSEMGQHDALGAGAVEPVGLGIAFFDGTLLAGEDAESATA
jgi:hypothetical protein